MVRVKSQSHLRVLDEINDLLMAITPGEMTVPPNDPRPSDIVVGVADDYLKRLDVLSRHLHENLQPLEFQLAMITTDIQRKVQAAGTSMTRLVAAAGSPEVQKMAERIEALQAEVAPKHELAKLARALFWVELKRRFPVVRGNNGIGLNSHWQVVYRDESKEPADDTSEDMPAELKQFLQTLGGNAHVIRM